MYVCTLSCWSFVHPVPYLPLLFQGVSASDLPTNQYLIFKLVKSELWPLQHVFYKPIGRANWFGLDKSETAVHTTIQKRNQLNGSVGSFFVFFASSCLLHLSNNALCAADANGLNWLFVALIWAWIHVCVASNATANIFKQCCSGHLSPFLRCNLLWSLLKYLFSFEIGKEGQVK